MVDNPFYPGFAPRKNVPENPLFPGYYPGKPITKRYKYNPKLVGRIPEFGTTAEFDAYLDAFTANVEHAESSIPKWVRERFADDFQSAFKITARPPTNLTTEQIDEYDTASLPGGGFVQLNTDPRDWIKDPIKMAQTTLTNWFGFKGALNIGDLETKARTELWEQITSDHPFHVSPNRRVMDSGQQEVLETMHAGYQFEYELTPTQQQSGGVTFTPYPMGINPLSLQNSGLIKGGDIHRAQSLRDIILGETSTGEKVGRDLGEDLRDAIKEYQRNSMSALTRETSYDKVVRAGTSFVSEDLRRLEANGQLVHLSASQLQAVHSYQQRSEVLSGLGDLGKNLVDINTNFDKVALLGGGPAREAISDIGKNMRYARNNLTSLRTNLVAAQASLPQEYYASLDGALNNLEQVLNSPEATEFLQAVDIINNPASTPAQIQAAIERAKSLQVTIQQRISMAPGFTNVLRGKALTGGDILTPSFERELGRQLWGETLDPTRGVGEVIVITKDGTDPILSARVQFLGQSMETQRLGSDLTQLSDTVQRGIGGFAEVYGWNNRIQKVVNPATRLWIGSPKEIVRTIYARLQNFGLVIDQDALKGTAWYINENKNFAPRGLTANNFNITVNDIDPRTGNAITRVSRVYGGDHFQGAALLNKWILIGRRGGMAALQFDDNDLRKLLIQGIRLTDVDASGNPIFAHLGFTAADLQNPNFVRDLQKLQDQIDNFRDYVTAHIATPNTNLTNLEFWKSIIEGTATRKDAQNRYIGVLTKIGNTVNRFQNKLYATRIGALVKKFTNKIQAVRLGIQQAVKDAVLKGAAEGAAKASLMQTANATAYKVTAKILQKTGLKAVLNTIGQVAGSFAPIIGNIIAFIIAEIVERIIRWIFSWFNKTFKFFKNLAKGDIDAVIQDWEKAQEKRRQRTLKFIFFILLIAVLFSQIISLLIPVIQIGFNVLGGMADPFDDPVVFSLSMFSPIDPTRKFGQRVQDYDWNITYGDAIPSVNPGPGGPGGPDPANPGPGPGPITPPPGWVPGHVMPGPVTAPQGPNCFEFLDQGTDPGGHYYFGPWTPQDIATFQAAIERFRSANIGSYLDRLCEGGTIYMYRTYQQNYAGSRIGWCSEVLSRSQIVWTSVCAYSASAVDYYASLVAHESGHIYIHRIGMAEFGGSGFSNAISEDGGTLPTYPISYVNYPRCSRSGMTTEDFAETVMNWVAIDGSGCPFDPAWTSWDAFWADFPGHFNYASTVLFR